MPRTRIALAVPVVAVVLVATVVVSLVGKSRSGGDHLAGHQDRSKRASAGLAFRPARLVEPTTIRLTPTDGTPKGLRPDRDYIIDLPSVPMQDGINIKGGHNVRIIGGQITTAGRAVYLHDQTGQMYVEGLKITGDGTTEGFDLDQRRGAEVVLQNIFIGGTKGSESTNHADLVQSWAGPRKLLIDHFEGTSGYQGFFLLPNQQWDEGPPPELFDFRNVLIDVQRGGYALWGSDDLEPMLTNVRVTPNARKPSRDQWLWPKPSQDPSSWRTVQAVSRTARRHVVDPSEVGIGYRSRASGGSTVGG